MLILNTAPSVEPVLLADVKMYSRIQSTDTSEDSLINTLITAARLYAESYCGRSFITQSWKLILDSFPGGCGQGFAPWGETYGMPDNAILLERGDVNSITSFTYLAMDGTTQTVSPSTYIADLVGCPARITPVFGQIWPANVMPQIGSVQLVYQAGYGAAGTNVPQGILQWILMRVATLYEYREGVIALPRGKVESLPFVDALLDPYVVQLA